MTILEGQSALPNSHAVWLSNTQNDEKTHGVFVGVFTVLVERGFSSETTPTMEKATANVELVHSDLSKKS
jgi:hypothetical protein